MGAPAIRSPRPAVPAPRRRRRSSSAAPARRTASPSRRASGARPAGSRRPKAAAAKGRRSRITPPGGIAMIPVQAVGGAAGAVGGMADSGVVVGLTRSRLWIGLLGVLLGGIVAINLWGLGLSASTSGTATKIDELERQNTVLEAQIAKRSSSERVQALAAGLGLESPTPKAVKYLKLRGGDPAAAAERLTAGDVSVLTGLPIAPELAGASLAPGPAAAPDVSVPTESTAATTPDPAASAPPPATAPPVTAAPAPTPTAPASSAGGGVAP